MIMKKMFTGFDMVLCPSVSEMFGVGSVSNTPLKIFIH